ncbi:hypothetical protein C6499_03010 [Candidatus Poribacteria bacterium]|nr:MAG: hypothetical protein C6499_03010 [Candidatus Poribacteria bacterium]
MPSKKLRKVLRVNDALLVYKNPKPNYEIEGINMQVDSTPFERRIRARALVVYAILAYIATLISFLILRNFLPAWFLYPDPLPEALSGFLLYVFFLLFTFRMLSRSGLSYRRLLGAFPGWGKLVRYSLWAVPLIILSLAAVYLLFFPLSFFFPGLVKSWLIDFYPTLIWTSGEKYVLANLLNFLMIVIIAPVFEEFFFRGILLTRWTVKWRVVPAVIVSSVAFSVPHVINLIGMFCVGCVLAVFYIRTKSLFVPISIHFVNNLVAWIIALLGIRFDILTPYTTITEFQESWWMGLLAIVISIPCVILFWRRYILNIDWRVPYLTEFPNSENNL